MNKAASYPEQFVEKLRMPQHGKQAANCAASRPTAIPRIDGCRDQRRHNNNVINQPEHVEFLHYERSDPTAVVAELLERHIDPKGTVVVWYAPFERGVNEEIGERLGSYASLMERINGQVQDLRDVFAKQYYVHPGFRGSTSIKKVLPVLVPKRELSYDD